MLLGELNTGELCLNNIGRWWNYIQSTGTVLVLFKKWCKCTGSRIYKNNTWNRCPVLWGKVEHDCIFILKIIRRNLIETYKVPKDLDRMDVEWMLQLVWKVRTWNHSLKIRIWRRPLFFLWRSWVTKRGWKQRIWIFFLAAVDRHDNEAKSYSN